MNYRFRNRNNGTEDLFRSRPITKASKLKSKLQIYSLGRNKNNAAQIPPLVHQKGGVDLKAAKGISNGRGIRKFKTPTQ